MKSIVNRESPLPKQHPRLRSLVPTTRMVAQGRVGGWGQCIESPMERGLPIHKILLQISFSSIFLPRTPQGCCCYAKNSGGLCDPEPTLAGYNK